MRRAASLSSPYAWLNSHARTIGTHRCAPAARALSSFFKVGYACRRHLAAGRPKISARLLAARPERSTVFFQSSKSVLGTKRKALIARCLRLSQPRVHRRLTFVRANSSLSSTERRGANLDREFLAVSKLKPPRSLCPECDANRTCRVFEIHPSHSENDWKETRVPCDKFRGFDYASLCICRKSFRLRLPLILFGFAREAFRALGNPRRDGSIFRPPFRMRSVLVFDESRHEH